MRRWITKRPIISYNVLTLVISWGYWLTLLALGKHVGPGSTASHLPGLLGPLLASVVITTYLNGKAGLAELMNRVLRFRSAWPGGILLALSPIPIAGLVFLVLYLLGTPFPSLHDFTPFPGLPAGLSVWSVLILVFIINGYGEEVGWRGFVTEQLLTRYSKFQTTLRVTALWILWHVPLFWLNQSMTVLVGPVLLGWAFGLLCGAFVLTYLYLLSGRSILVLAIWHTTYNMMVAPPAGTGLPAAVITTLVMTWGMAIAWIWWKDMRGKLTK
jgi:uncharacterized protein